MLTSLDALHGLPGPYIKYFSNALGPNGIYKMIKDWDDKNAQAICLMGYMENPHSPIQIFKGIVNGTIVEPRGDKNFGWDPCFQPNGYDQTFAEMDSINKNKISHRYLCTIELKKFLDQNFI